MWPIVGKTSTAISPADSTAHAVTLADTDGTEALAAIELTNSRLQEIHRESPSVFRPRNYMVTFVASNPVRLDVLASFCLESVETGFVQKRSRHFTIECRETHAIRGDTPIITSRRSGANTYTTSRMSGAYGSINIGTTGEPPAAEVVRRQDGCEGRRW